MPKSLSTRILHAEKEPQNWLTYSGTTLGQRYSTLKQITPDNVKDLTMQWAFQARSTEKFESTPLVVDGMMYVTQAPNDVVALDAATGEIKWLYSYAVSRDARPCCGRINRGLAILGSTLYMGTIDAHLVALDAHDGKLLWDTEVAKATSGYAPYARSFDRERQSHHGRRRRRVRHPRFHRRLQRLHRQGSLALLHHPRQGRARQRNLGR